MEEWFETDACDGFVLAATHCPGAYEDFVRLVVPELSAEACSGDQYTGTTLRENLGLARPDCATPRAPLSPGRPAGRLRGVDAGDAWRPVRWRRPRLGEFGADVIKIEQPGAATRMRTWGARKDGIGLVWKSVSRNKRCVTLDLRQPEGQELLHQLLDLSDVLVVNTRPSALTRWGLDYARCTCGIRES